MTSTRAPAPRSRERLASIVESTLRKGTDLRVLSTAAVQHGPRKKKEYINDYLDWYNTTMAYRSFSKTVVKHGEEYVVPDAVACRQFSLFQTYRRMARDRGLDVGSWTYHPQQRRIE